MPLCKSANHCISAALVAFGFAFSIVKVDLQEPASVVLSYLAPSEVVLHEPIVVSIIAQNSRPEPVRLRFGLGATRNFAVKIRRPDGVVVNAPPVPQITDGPYDTGVRSVPASGQFTHRLVLNRWFTFDQPGTYAIEIGLETPVETEYGAQVPATTRGALTIQVGGRDISALHRMCQELVARIRNTTDLRVRGAAAVELANVTDRVAIGYISQVLDFTDSVDRELIPALVRMGSLEAQSVLEEMAHGHNLVRASQAKQALYDSAKRKR